MLDIPWVTKEDQPFAIGTNLFMHWASRQHLGWCMLRNAWRVLCVSHGSSRHGEAVASLSHVLYLHALGVFNDFFMIFCQVLWSGPC